MTQIKNIPLSLFPKIKACVAYIQSQKEPVSFARLVELAGVSTDVYSRDRRNLAQALTLADGIWRAGKRSHPVFGHGEKPARLPPAPVGPIGPDVAAKAMADCTSAIRGVSEMFDDLGVNSSDLQVLCGSNKRVWEHVRDVLKVTPGYHTLGGASTTSRFDEEVSK